MTALAPLALALLAAAPALRPTPAELRASRAITAPYLLGHTRFLASDLLEGRGPATRGDQLTQTYIAAQLEALGLYPGADGGGWFQPFDIVGLTGNPGRLHFSSGKDKLELRYHDEFIAVAGAQKTALRLSDAEVVFVGYGIVAPEQRWDDYKGVDLRGKVLLMMNSDPEGDPALFAGKTRLRYGRWDYKYESAEKVGAAGAIIIHTTPSAGYPWQVVQSSWAGEQFELPHTDGSHRMELKGFTTEEASRRIAALGGKDLDALRAAAERRDFRPVPLGVRLSTSFKNVVAKKQTSNVLAVIKGRDPRLSGELVVYTAHHDHLGVLPSAPGADAIYNGAVDNATGVAGLLALARAFQALPQRPRRSILFAAVAAEEQGLLGSQYLAQHPPVPAGRLAANINLDGLNIWGRTKDVTAIGLGKSNLDALLRGLAAYQGRTVKPDELSDRGFFYRSDQFSFAKIGVPAAYFGSGLDFAGKPDGWGRQQRERWEEAHYHQPSDEVSPRWDLSGAVEDTQLYFWLGHRVANATRAPAWRQGDEFEVPRLEALRRLKSRQAPARP